MRLLIKKVLDYQIRNSYIEENEKNIYEYAYIILAEECINFAISFTIAAIFKRVVLVFAFLCSYIPLRRFAGGYHADNGIRCGIVSAILIFILCIISKFGIADLLGKSKYILLVMCQIGIFALSPVDSKNKQLSMYEKQKSHRIVAEILAFQILAILIGVLKNEKWLNGIIYSHIVLNCMLFIGIYKKHAFGTNDIQEV